MQTLLHIGFVLALLAVLVVLARGWLVVGCYSCLFDFSAVCLWLSSAVLVTIHLVLATVFLGGFLSLAFVVLFPTFL